MAKVLSKFNPFFGSAGAGLLGVGYAKCMLVESVCIIF